MHLQVTIQIFSLILIILACKHRESPESSATSGAAALCTYDDGELAPCLTQDPAASNNLDFEAMLTLYTTENTAMEGGPKDRCGKPLGTLKDFLSGAAQVVSLAMDSKAFPYGTQITIPEISNRLNQGKPIPFMIVDTGSLFKNKGTRRIDLCVGHSQDHIKSEEFNWISKKTFAYSVVKMASGKPGTCPKDL